MSRSADQRAIYRALGRAIREVREAKSPFMSQNTLARVAGKDRAYVSAIERGERRPTYATIVALAAGLGVSLSDLVDRAARLEQGEGSKRRHLGFDRVGERCKTRISGVIAMTGLPLSAGTGRLQRT
jgi:transcriptional regulator with XRE-family HTH domain